MMLASSGKDFMLTSINNCCWRAIADVIQVHSIPEYANGERALDAITGNHLACRGTSRHQWPGTSKPVSRGCSRLVQRLEKRRAPLTR